jgi:CubicO group peptidase (beta-lactamase class C family)
MPAADTLVRHPLPASSPAAQGVDASAIGAFLERIESAPDIELHGLVILRHGHVIAAGWWWPYTPDRLHLLYSLSKSFTATAAGLALSDGLLNLDAPVIGYFPELAAEVTDDRLLAMKVRHIAAMASGHADDTWDRVRTTGDLTEPVRNFLAIPPERDPGSVFAYNQLATYTLGAIVQRVTGQGLVDYLRRRALDHVGAGPVSWMRDEAGRELGFSGLHATTDTVARLGQLYLRDGCWNGKQILPAAWVTEATSRQISTRSARPADVPDWLEGYGFQFWRSRHGYRADGAYGQFSLVLPEQDAVVAITGQTIEPQNLLDAVWCTLLPAFQTAAWDPTAADSALRERLIQLAIPLPAGAPLSSAAAAHRVSTTFRPAGGTCEQQPSLRAVTVRHAGQWRVRLDEEGSALDLIAGDEEWTVSKAAGGAPPMASAGRWIDSDTAGVDVIFLETPHRLTVTCQFKTHTFEARWITAPLHEGPLRTLQAPRLAQTPPEPNRND